MQRADVRENLEKRGVDPEGAPPQEFAALIQRELPKWQRVIQEVGLQAQ